MAGLGKPVNILMQPGRMNVRKRAIGRSVGMSPITEQTWRKRLAAAGLLVVVVHSDIVWAPKHLGRPC